MPAATEIQTLGAIFAGLLGLAFGSFLNVVLTRLPAGESIINPASHCRDCTHTLSWWENIPLLSWLLLKGRCRQCQTPISPRYPLIELAIATLWIVCWFRFGRPVYATGAYEDEIPHLISHSLTQVIGYAVLLWIISALALLDAEHYWLPDSITLPGIALGFLFTLLENSTHWFFDNPESLNHAARNAILAIVAAAAIVLIIRLLYWLIRRKEGMGLGDAKLMAMLGAWLGLIGALETFALAILAATAAALIYLALLTLKQKKEAWAKLPLPLGAFLCLAAIPEIFASDWLWNWYSRTFLP